MKMQVVFIFLPPYQPWLLASLNIFADCALWRNEPGLSFSTTSKFILPGFKKRMHPLPALIPIPFNRCLYFSLMSCFKIYNPIKCFSLTNPASAILFFAIKKPQQNCWGAFQRYCKLKFIYHLCGYFSTQC